MPEAWLRGPVEGVAPHLMPAAHALLDAWEEIEGAASSLTVEELWHRPGGAASVGFHLEHAAGSIRRLLTYARGEALSSTQLASLKKEGEPGTHPAEAFELLRDLREALAEALGALRNAPEEELQQPRKVGRAGLPSTVMGLLFHAAEHARRHGGQIVTTVKILRGLGLARGDP